MQKKEKSKRSLPIKILRGTILLVVLAAAIVLVLRLMEYKQGSDVYGQLRLEMGVDETASSASTADGEDKGEPPLLTIDFERLWEENEEVVAWLEFPALNLNYPIMHTDNNDYYLSHLWDGQENSSGSIFLDANNKSVDDLYTVVYGHNMHDGSMFGLFNRYLDENFCKENDAYFRLYTPDAVWRYDIFTVSEVPNNHKLYTVGYTTGNLYDSFLEPLAACTLYDTGYHVESGDTVMTLSTCTARDTVRRVLCGRRAKKLK